mgnify:CR=1 FL=1
MSTCLIDVGGGLRGVYGAGVMDRCMDMGIVFDGVIGVSAGAANLTSYLSGQRGRCYRFYFTYSFRPDYMGMGNFIPLIESSIDDFENVLKINLRPV